MIDVTVKTLDSNNHRYSVPDDITVKQFKERIASSVNIPADKQRLIYCGRVLNDEKNLSDYNVHEKVIHLVMRAPPQSNSRNSDRRSTGTGSSSGSSSRQRQNVPCPSSSEMRLRQARHMLSVAAGFLNWLESEVNTTSNEQEQRPQTDQAGPSNAGTSEEPMDVTETESSNRQEAQSANQSNQSSVLNMFSDPLATYSDTDFPRELELYYQELDALNNISSPDSAPNLMAMTSGMRHPFIGSMTNGLQGGLVQAASAAFVSALSSIGASPLRGSANGGSSWTSIPVSTSNSRQSSTPATTASTSNVTNPIPNGPTAEFANNLSSGSDDSEPPSRDSAPSTTGNPVGGLRGFTVRITNRGLSQPSAMRLNHPPCSVMVEVLNQYREVQRRLQPFLDRFSNIMAQDRAYEEGVSTNQMHSDQFIVCAVSYCLHYLSHALHAISDIMVDLRRPPPRQLRARPFIIPQPALVQAQINVGPHPVDPHQPPGTSESTNTSETSAPSTSTTSTSTVTSESASGMSGSVDDEDHHHPSSVDAQATIVSVPEYMDEDNEVVLMHLGPNGITIDSLAAEEGGVDSAANPPRDLIHNLMSSITSQLGMRLGGVRVSQSAPSSTRTSSASSASSDSSTPNTTSGVRGPPPVHNSQATGNSGTSTTNATQTRVTPRLQQVHVTPLQIPGDALIHFDQFLPCQSHLIVNRDRRRHRAAVQTGDIPCPRDSNANSAENNTSEQRPTTSTVPTTSSSNDRSAVANAASSFVSDILNGGRIFDNGNSNRELTQEEQQQDRMIRRLTQIVMSELSGVPRGAGEAEYEQPLEQFLEPFAGSGLLAEGENTTILSRLFLTVSQILSIGDLVQLFFGNLTSLSLLHEPLRTFVREVILSDTEPSQENMDRAIDQIISDVNYHILEATNDASVFPEIDYVSTVHNFLRHRLHDIFDLILNHDDSNTFGSVFMNLLLHVMNEFFALSIHCFIDGPRGLENMVENRVQSILSGMNPSLRSWSGHLSVLQLRTILSNLNISGDRVNRYVVLWPDQGASVDRTGRDNRTSTNVPSSQGSISVSVAGSTQISSSTVVNSASGDNEVGMDAVGVSASIPNGAESVVRSDGVSDVGDTSQSWHSTVPREWIPVITRDVERQRRRVPDTNLSDGYLCGMPLKRRKIVTKNKPNGTVQKVLQDTLRQSLRNSGVNKTLVDSVSSEVSTELGDSFASHARNVLQEELKENEDFNPERFPNSEQRIRKK